MRESDYDVLNSQRFTDAIIERERIHDLCRVLYPNDSTHNGKALHARQQHFFVPASLQAMIDSYTENHGGDPRDFCKHDSI